MNIVWLSMLVFFYSILAYGQKDEWLTGAFRVSTNVSSGRTTFSDIAELASNKNLDFVVFSDQFIVKGEYGIPPFRQVFKYSKERRSIKTYGIKKYLDEIESVQRLFPDIVLIPGADVAPVYYWSRSPLSPPLIAHQWSEQLTVLGSHSPEFYENLPILHNEKYGVQFPETLIKWFPLTLTIFGLLVISRASVSYRDDRGRTFYIREWRRIVMGIFVSIVSLLWFLNNRPLTVTFDYDQYSDPGMRPFDALFEYVQGANGLCFWSAPEAEMTQNFGRVRLESKPYIYDVERCLGHNGFAALYGDRSTAYLAGKHWDRMLLQYCSGKRPVRPVIVGEIDYHADRDLDLILTVVRAEAGTENQIIESLRNGHSYAVSGPLAKFLTLDTVSLINNDAHGSLGDRVRVSGSNVILSISGRFAETSGIGDGIKGILSIIVNGKNYREKTITGSEIRIHEVLEIDKEQQQYIRFYIRYPGVDLVANSIFIECER